MTVKLKNYCGYFAIVCTIVILCFSSCSNKENIIDDEPTVDASLMSFVGYWWHLDNSMLLFDDGTGYYFVDDNSYECTWGFNNNTQLFSIAWLNQTKTLSLVKWDETTIMGVNISTNKSYTYTKEDNSGSVPLNLLRNINTLVSTSTNDKLYVNKRYYRVYLSSKDCFYLITDDAEEVNSNSIIWPFSLYYGSYIHDTQSTYACGKGYLTINNPFHPSKTTFTFNQNIRKTSSFIDGTYKVLDE